MTITMFQKKNCKGTSMKVSRNYSSLKKTTVGNHPSSMTMTSANDVILMFKKDDWHGGVLYRCGKQTIESLGSKKDGGKALWGNAVTSVRCTPFTVRLNVTVVQDEDGAFPGDFNTGSEAEAKVKRIVGLVNNFYTRENALLKLKISTLTCRKDGKKFVLDGNKFASIPGKWKKSGEIDTIFVERFGKDGVTGRASPPYWGKTCIVTAKGAYTDGTRYDRDEGDMARTLAHELGHFLGLGHGTANKKKGNIMYKEGLGHSIDERGLNADQIEEMHRKLARNITRKGNRVE